MMDYAMFEMNICDFKKNVVFEVGKKYEILSEEYGKVYVSHGKKNKNECSSMPANMQGMKIFNEGPW